MLKRTIVSLAVLAVGYQSCLALPTVPSRTDLPIPAVLDAAPEPKPVSGEFGLVDESGGFTATSEVPMVVGQDYGWRIKVDSAEGIVHWKEEFQLPSAPKTWGGNKPGDKLAAVDDGQVVNEEGKVCVTEKDSSARTGYIFNFWSVAKGDPLGKYEMRVYIDGKLFKTFNFEVVAEDPAKTLAREKEAKARVAPAKDVEESDDKKQKPTEFQ